MSFFVSVKFHGAHRNHKVEVNLATLSFGDITGFKTVVSVCLIHCSADCQYVCFRIIDALTSFFLIFTITAFIYLSI